MTESLKRKRARFAYDRVMAWDASWREKAVQRIKGLPVQVRTQGLSTALATLIHQDNAESRALADLLADWLLNDSPHKPLDVRTLQARDRDALLKLLVRADRASYLAAQCEAIGLLDEVKTLGQAIVAGGSHG
jgi:hypothetical protein